MVSSTDNNNHSVEEQFDRDLPEGRYQLIGWDIDTTGRRLIDEICQIAAYTPNSKFAQYIMPYGDLNIQAQRRHSLRVITMSRYRMLKDLITNKFVKTKSEISALTDFINWLEEVQDTKAIGAILVFHETHKMAPSMLLEALKRYNLFDRFAAIVKGFANSFSVAKSKCGQTMKSFSIKVLSRVLLDKEEELNSAADRAKICYNIVLHLGQGERQDLDTEEGIGDTGASERHAAELVRQYTCSVASEQQDLLDLKKFLERQNTFRPVFKELMRFDWVSRKNASRLRRSLVENDLDYNQMKQAWEAGGKQSLEEILKKIPDSNEKDFADLLEIFDCFFDPEKLPVTAKFNHRKRRISSKSQKENKQDKANKGNNTPSEASGNSDTGSPKIESLKIEPKIESKSESLTIEPKSEPLPNNESQAPVVITVQ